MRTRWLAVRPMRGAVPIAVLTLAAAGWVNRPAPGPSLDDFRVVDLTRTLAQGVPIFPGGEPFRLTNLIAIEAGHYANKMSLGEHVGTHVDAPSHFQAGGMDVDVLAPEALIGPLVVLDLREVADPDLAISVDQVRAHEAAHGPIPEGAFVAARTGWGERWGEPTAYVNLGADGLTHFPGFSPEAARYLVDSRKIRGLGIDTLSVDPGAATTYPVHKIVMGAGKINVENLAGLDALPVTGATLVVAPLKIAHGSGAPARVFALVPGALSSP